MSRRDDRDRSRTRRRRDRSPSPQAHKARRREHHDTQVSENMDWNNLVSWQHNSGYNSGYNAANNFPTMPTNFQTTPSFTQQFQYPATNYMMPIPPDPTPSKFSTPVMPPPVTTSQPTPTPGLHAALPVRPQKAWLTPSPDWTPGDGMFDVNQLYNFSLPMTVANTPHGNLRDMSGMDLRDVRLVQVIHGGLTNWLLRPFAHGRFVTWEGFRTRTEALLWSTCSKLLRRSQSLNLLTLEKDLANTLGLNIDDFNQRIKVHDHLANLVLQFLQQHHTSLAPSTQADDMVKKFNDLNRAHELLQAQYSASLRASTSPTMTNHKDDAELTTPPPVNITPSSSPASSLLTASAAALDGKSFDNVMQPRIMQSLHGVSSPPPKPATSQLLTMHSTPDEVVKYYTWISDQPRLFLKQAPTTTTLASLVKWANHPSRLNGNKSLDSMATQLIQARQRMPKGDAPTLGAMAASWGLEPGYLTKLTEKALSHLIVTARLLCG